MGHFVVISLLCCSPFASARQLSQAFVAPVPPFYGSFFGCNRHSGCRKVASGSSSSSSSSSISSSSSNGCKSWSSRRPQLHMATPATSSSSSSQLPKEELIRIAKEFASNPTVDKLADDFVFRGPVIGPLCRDDFVATLEGVSGGDGDLSSAFPDLRTNAFGFTADDPVEPNRVWYFERPRGTFTGPFNHPVVGRIEPTGAEYAGPPEARSVVIDGDGLVRHVTVGYVTDRFAGDTTGGRGAVMGMYAVMGQEIDARVGSPVTVWLQRLSALLPEGTVPRSYSSREDLPEWWTDKRMGAED